MEQLYNITSAVDSLKNKGYTNHQNDTYCKKTGTTTTCFCTGNNCNDGITEPKPTSGASSTAGGVSVMAGAILLARLV